MAKHRGGRKLLWKKPGRTSAKKCYQDYLRTQLNTGQTNNGDGKWIKADALNMKSRAIGYQGWYY